MYMTNIKNNTQNLAHVYLVTVYVQCRTDLDEKTHDDGAFWQ